MENEKRRRKPKRIKLSAEESLKRMKAYPSRMSAIIARIRKGKRT